MTQSSSWNFLLLIFFSSVFDDRSDEARRRSHEINICIVCFSGVVNLLKFVYFDFFEEKINSFFR
jgi:hypothetical protein